MAEQELFDALADCIDRVLAGAAVEDCLRDYPQYAGRLRQLLEAGELVQRAHYPDALVTEDQNLVRDRVISAMRRQESQKPHRFVLHYALAAVLMLVIVGFAAVFVLMMPNRGGQSSVPEVGFASTQTLQATPTRPGSGIIVGATSLPTIGVSPPPTMTPLPSMVPSEIRDVEATLGPLMTATPVDPDANTTAHTPLPSVVFTSTPVPLLSATVLPPVTATPVPTLAPSEAVNPVSTSVVLLTPTILDAQATVTAVPPQAITVTATPIPTSTGPLPTVAAPPLNAGEIDDNARWDTYLIYRRSFLERYAWSVHDVDVTGRQIIHVTDALGQPVLGASVQVYAGQTLVSASQTYADGRTLFFPNARSESDSVEAFQVVVTKGTARASLTLDPRNGPEWTVQLDLDAAQDRIRLDVLFLLDSTGSMADEIAQLQDNILAISGQIAALPGDVDTRYGLVTYRDRGDEYITRVYDFTPDVLAFQADLSSVQALDGGDTPESLNAALYDAVHNVEWRGDDTVKLVFLVADAPPHLDYDNDQDYAQEMVSAAANGIKIHPIASSGLDQQGEFIFRQIAQYTMGHFIFLTYEQGTGGAPGETRRDLDVGEPGHPELQQPGDYTVEKLDELVMRLIRDELAHVPVKEQAAAFIGSDEPPSAGAASNVQGLYLPAALVLVGLSFLFGFALWWQSTQEKRKNTSGDVRLGDLFGQNHPS